MEVLVVSERANDQALACCIYTYAGIGSAFLVGWDLKIFNALAFYFVVSWFKF